MRTSTLRIFLIGLCVVGSVEPLRAEDGFLGLRSRMRESCSTHRRWSAPIRLKGVPLEVGRLVWACPASFRLEYQGPGAFVYSSNGVEAWVARPSFTAKSPEIQHHWRLSGTDLDLALAYLRGDETSLALLRTHFKADTSLGRGTWSVKLSPLKPEDFQSLRLEWSLSRSELSAAEWTSVEGLSLQFEIGRPEDLTPGTMAADVVPKIPVGARVVKIPAIRKKP